MPWPPLAAALIVALGFWGWDAWSKDQAAKASLTYGHAMQVLGEGKNGEAEADFKKVSETGPAVFKALAFMQLAGLRQTEHKDAEAAALLDKAEAAAPDRVTKDAAALKAGLILIDTAPLAEIRRRLEPLTGKDRPFRDMAREGLGVARLYAGKPEEARADFAALSLSPQITEGMRARAKGALAIIDAGTAGSIPPAAKEAAKLPPQMTIPTPPGAMLAPPGAAGAPPSAQ